MAAEIGFSNPTKGVKKDCFWIGFELPDDKSKITVIIHDNAPKMTLPVNESRGDVLTLTLRTFYYRISYGDIMPGDSKPDNITEPLPLALKDPRIIDAGNKLGKRQVIYRQDLDINTFKTNDSVKGGNYLIEIFTDDDDISGEEKILLHQIEVEITLPQTEPPDNMSFTEKRIREIIEERIINNDGRVNNAIENRLKDVDDKINKIIEARKKSTMKQIEDIVSKLSAQELGLQGETGVKGNQIVPVLNAVINKIKGL